MKLTVLRDWISHGLSLHPVSAFLSPRTSTKISPTVFETLTDVSLHQFAPSWVNLCFSIDSCNHAFSEIPFTLGLNTQRGRRLKHFVTPVFDVGCERPPWSLSGRPLTPRWWFWSLHIQGQAHSWTDTGSTISHLYWNTCYNLTPDPHAGHCDDYWAISMTTGPTPSVRQDSKGHLWPEIQGESNLFRVL